LILVKIFQIVDGGIPNEIRSKLVDWELHMKIKSVFYFKIMKQLDFKIMTGFLFR